jgi:hypothetical protein
MIGLNQTLDSVPRSKTNASSTILGSASSRRIPRTLVEVCLLIASYVASNVSFPFHVQETIQAYKGTKIDFLFWNRSVTNYTKGAHKPETVCIKVKQTLDLSPHAWSTGESAH